MATTTTLSKALISILQSHHMTATVLRSDDLV